MKTKTKFIKRKLNFCL